MEYVVNDREPWSEWARERHDVFTRYSYHTVNSNRWDLNKIWTFCRRHIMIYFHDFKSLNCDYNCPNFPNGAIDNKISWYGNTVVSYKRRAITRNRKKFCWRNCILQSCIIRTNVNYSHLNSDYNSNQSIWSLHIVNIVNGMDFDLVN